VSGECCGSAAELRSMFIDYKSTDYVLRPPDDSGVDLLYNSKIESMFATSVGGGAIW